MRPADCEQENKMVKYIHELRLGDRIELVHGIEALHMFSVRDTRARVNQNHPVIIVKLEHLNGEPIHMVAVTVRNPCWHSGLADSEKTWTRHFPERDLVVLAPKS
jgi:hypothetical protein